jgi:thiopeptide-type bacteriocin biosynthesis protein
LTSAHNYHLSQGIYWFLCALQSQGTIGDLGWSWGPLRDAPFLPRVVHGRLVLSRARWHVAPGEVKPSAEVNGARRFRAMQNWRASRRLPRWIALVDADNELPIDLDNVLAVDTFLELVKARENFTLVEFFPGPDQLWACGPEGRFVHEFVVPFIRDKERGRKGEEEKWRRGDRKSDQVMPRSLPVPVSSQVPVSPSQLLSASASRRSFPLGSEWLYAKLYSGPATLDQMLLQVVRPVVESVTRSGAVDRWFFVRYGDPEWHLRLRFHGEPSRLSSDVLPLLQDTVAPLLADRRLWRIQFDTYEREVERYGGLEGIELAERFFHADSEAVLSLAEWFPGDTRGDLRWRLALVGMDLLMADLDFDLNTRLAVVHKARDTFASEFHIDVPFKHLLAAKFRSERRSLEALFEHNIDENAQIRHGTEILRQRSARLTGVLNELKLNAKNGRLSLPLTELAPSYLHMHANRLLRSAQRAQELVLYDFLCRLYNSRAARMSSD